jgi:hypothetical protein
MTRSLFLARAHDDFQDISYEQWRTFEPYDHIFIKKKKTAVSGDGYGPIGILFDCTNIGAPNAELQIHLLIAITTNPHA